MRISYILIFTCIFAISTTKTAFSKSSFKAWKKSYIKRAAKRGTPTSFLKKEFKNVKFLKEVIEKDRNQVTSNKNIDYPTWIKKWKRSDPSRVDVAREMLKENLPLLLKIEKKYKVDKEIIISLWGVETFFGKITGDYDIINSLASLSYDGRRRKFFETQLTAALRLIYKGHVTRENLKGSWAGATGQCQFMPSNIPGFAQDFDRDGKKDIWTNKADIFASIANLLKKSGWKKGYSLGILVNNKKLNKNKPHFKLDKYRSAKQYRKLGFTMLNGEKLTGNWKRIVAILPFKNSPFILRGSNYKPLMKWNRSSLFAAFNIIMLEGLK